MNASPRTSGLLDLALRVEEVHWRKPRNAIAFERQFPLPHRLAAAAAILRALPSDAHAPTEIGRCEGTHRPHDLCAVQHVEALDRRGAYDLGGKPHRHRAGTDDVAHRGLAHRELLCAGKLRVFGKTRDRLIERAAQVEEHAWASGAIVVPATQRLEQGVAGELGHELAGEPADRTEGRGARPRRARSSLVIVAVAHDSDAIASL